MSTIKCSRLSTGYTVPPVSYVRFLHASPDMLPVDVYANDKLVVSGLTYLQITDYFMVTPCDYCIKVYPAIKSKGKGDNFFEDDDAAKGKPYGMYKSQPAEECRCPLTEACLVLGVHCTMTVALVCPQPVTGLLAIQEHFDAYKNLRNPNQAAIRFVNLASDAPPLDVTWQDGTVLFRGVAFSEHTRYVRVDPGTYAFKLKPTGSNQPGITTSNFTLERGIVYTLYAVGLVEGTPPLEAIISTDGLY
jgi:hypothetical protein